MGRKHDLGQLKHVSALQDYHMVLRRYGEKMMNAALDHTGSGRLSSSLYTSSANKSVMLLKDDASVDKPLSASLPIYLLSIPFRNR